MNTPPEALTEEDLLAEFDWVRRLAQRLVRDHAAADDIAQETYLVALERPPHSARTGASLRAWLSSVTRTLARMRARGEARRSRREARVARSERDDRDLVEAVALRRDVVAAVLALDEPYRSTLLRYHFEGRSVSEIARLSGASNAAVRQRLVRARASLKDRLQQAFGNEQGGWCRALSPLLREQGGARPRFRLPPFLYWGASAAAAALLLAGALGIGGMLKVDEPTSPEPDHGGQAPVRYSYLEPELELFPDPRAVPAREGLAGWLQESLEERASSAPPMPPRTASLLSFGTLRRELRGGGMGSQDADAFTLSEQTSFPISQVVRLDPPSKERAGRVAEHAGHSADLIEQAQLFSARCERAEQGDRVPVHVVRMPLDRNDLEQRLVVLVHEGRTSSLSAWGSRTLDDDPDLRWGTFLQQMLRVQADGVPLSLDTPGFPELTDLKAELEERDDEDARLARALLTQRVAMAGHSMAGTAGRSLETAGALPSAEWYPPMARRMRSLSKVSAEFEFILGEEGARQHARMALVAADAFEEYGRALGAGEAEEIERVKRTLSRACSSCHRATGESGTSFFDAFEPYTQGLGLPRGGIQLELDLAPALGDDGELSARLAAAYRAALVLVSALD